MFDMTRNALQLSRLSLKSGKSMKIFYDIFTLTAIESSNEIFMSLIAFFIEHFATKKTIRRRIDVTHTLDSDQIRR